MSKFKSKPVIFCIIFFISIQSASYAKKKEKANTAMNEFNKINIETINSNLSKYMPLHEYNNAWQHYHNSVKLYLEKEYDESYKESLIAINILNNLNKLALDRYDEYRSVILKLIRLDLPLKDTDQGFSVSMLDTMLYKGRNIFTLSEKGIQRIEALVLLMKMYPSNKIIIEGHTQWLDRSGYCISKTEEIKKYLIEKMKIDESKIETKLLSNSVPVLYYGKLRSLDRVCIQINIIR